MGGLKLYLYGYLGQSRSVGQSSSKKTGISVTCPPRRALKGHGRDEITGIRTASVSCDEGWLLRLSLHAGMLSLNL